jgi:hypothetical protein
MKHVLDQGTYAIILLHSHGVVLALSQYNTNATKREITYAHQVRIIHDTNISSDDMLAKIYDTYRFALEKFSTDIQTLPEKFIIYLGDSLSHSVFRKHSMKRKTPFKVTEKLLSDIQQKDLQKILQQQNILYHQPHRIVHTGTHGRSINGYRFIKNTGTLPKQIFSLEYTLEHTVVPEKLITNLEYTMKSLYHNDVPVTYRSMSGVIIGYLADRVNGPFLYVHIGESSTTLYYVCDAVIHTQIHVPVGTGQLVYRVMQEQKITFTDAGYVFNMVYDDRVISSQAQEIRVCINEFWHDWQQKLTVELEKLVIKGATIPKIIYSYDTEMVHIDQEVFPKQPYELWYGSRNVQHVPCEAVLGSDDPVVNRAYIKSLLLFIQEKINL